MGACSRWMKGWVWEERIGRVQINREEGPGGRRRYTAASRRWWSGNRGWSGGGVGQPAGDSDPEAGGGFGWGKAQKPKHKQVILWSDEPGGSGQPKLRSQAEKKH